MLFFKTNVFSTSVEKLRSAFRHCNSQHVLAFSRMAKVSRTLEELLGIVVLRLCNAKELILL